MLTKKHFGITQGNKEVDVFTIKNSNGIELSITNYGGRVTSLLVPDKSGKIENIVLGFNNLENYLSDDFYLGASIGRYANRIAKGKFVLDGNQFSLPINDGSNHLHGGINGFDKVVWDAVEVINKTGIGIELFYSSNDGDEGYPGELETTITYILTEQDELIIEYKAETNKPTPVNFTHHSYFNLSGDLNNPILDHELKIYSDKFLESDSESIPTGKILSVESTPFDFCEYRKLGERINANDIQIKNGHGYDHCYLVENKNSELILHAEIYEPTSGRLMEVYSTEPAIQLYSGNHLTKEKTYGKFGKRTALCLEPQHYPDSPNHSEFPNTILKPGEVFYSKTKFKFKTR